MRKNGETLPTPQESTRKDFPDTRPLRPVTKPVWKKILVITTSVLAILLLVIGVALTVFWVGYPPTSVSTEIVKNNPELVVDRLNYISILGKTSGSEKILLFYPGAGVQPRAYVHNLFALRDVYRYILIVKFPANLAVLANTRGDTVLTEFLQDFHYSTEYLKSTNIVLAGHSLGGAMLSEYYSRTKYKSLIQGVIFMGAYPSSNSLKDVALPALFLYGEKDGLIETQKVTASTEGWKNAKTEIIAGMNHAQWGDYGDQNGDLKPDVSSETAQKNATQKIREWTTSLH